MNDKIKMEDIKLDKEIIYEIDEKIIDKFNEIGCTSWIVTKEELEELVRKAKEDEL